MNPDKILGMVGGGKKLKIELYDIKALREYAKSLKINVTKNNKYITKDVLLNKIKKKFN